MPTLVLSNRYSSDSIALRKAALDGGWDVERLTSWRITDGLESRDPVLYGEPLFNEVVAASLGLEVLQPPVDWLARLPECYRLRRVELLTLAEARQAPRPVFLKPPNEKSFPALVYNVGEPIPAENELPQDMPVLVAEPVTWEREYRCFVLDRRVITSSPYLVDGKLARDEEGRWTDPENQGEAALEFTSRVLADRDIQFPEAVVIDVGRIAGRGWAVVEANEASGSGIYGCNPSLVLSVVRRASRSRIDPEH